MVQGRAIDWLVDQMIATVVVPMAAMMYQMTGMVVMAVTEIHLVRERVTIVGSV